MHTINMDTIVQDPSPVLRAKSDPVSLPPSPEDTQTLLEMLQYVKDSKDEELVEKFNLLPAVGIAAPQIGINKQMVAIVVDEAINDEVITHEYALINPKIVSHSLKQAALIAGEGCLSVRDPHEGLVQRHQRIKVKAYDLLAHKDIEIIAKDYLAIVLQHEIDHLQGILYYDHINTDDPWSHDEKLKVIE